MAEPTDLQKLISRCEQEETKLQLRSFTNDQALNLGLKLVETARAADMPVAVDITRHGQQLFHHGMDGTYADNDAWIQRKNRTVNLTGFSSYHFFLRLQQSGETAVDRGMNPMEYAIAGGAFPIRIIDAGLIGTVTVSGLPHEQDHALVVNALVDFLNV